MKNATGVFLEGTLYLGGGYTGSSRTDPVVYMYNLASGQWRQLPPCPLKWSAVTALGGKLVLVGSRVAKGAKVATYTNKVAVWNADTEEWEFPLPFMVASRMCPVVISHGDHLIAAGGKKGSMDFEAEVLHEKAGKWGIGPSLPFRCTRNSSALVGAEWFLVDLSNGAVDYCNVEEYIATSKRFLGTPTTPPSFGLWHRLEHRTPAIPFKIACVSSHLMAFSDDHLVSITAHMYQNDVWIQVTGKFPCNASSGLFIDSESEENVAYVLGGEVNQQYSSQAHELHFMTRKDFKEMKKNRQITLSE